MKRLIAAAALTSALFATGAQAQTVTDEVTKQLWCGTAMVVAFSDPPPGTTDDQLQQAKTFIAAGEALLAAAVQAHLDAGFTQEAVDKIKVDLVPVVTEQVTGAKEAQFTFEECLEIIPADQLGGSPSDQSSSSAM